MKLRELKNCLANAPESNIRFCLPGGSMVLAHAHVSEAARIDKRFIDCGGTRREDAFCRLQTWVAEDFDHRLKSRKLLRILEMAKSVLQSDDLEVDIELELEFISQFPLASVQASNSELVLHLSTRHTACLAQDKCCPAPAAAPAFDPINFAVRK